jgi:hypothetical protein
MHMGMAGVRMNTDAHITVTIWRFMWSHVHLKMCGVIQFLAAEGDKPHIYCRMEAGQDDVPI